MKRLICTDWGSSTGGALRIERSVCAAGCRNLAPCRARTKRRNQFDLRRAISFRYPQLLLFPELLDVHYGPHLGSRFLACDFDPYRPRLGVLTSSGGRLVLPVSGDLGQQLASPIDATTVPSESRRPSPADPACRFHRFAAEPRRFEFDRYHSTEPTN